MKLLKNMLSLTIIKLCFSVTELSRRRRNSIMSLSEVNFIGITPRRILEDVANNPDLVLKINDSVFSGIGRPKLAHNKHTIWEIPAFIDC